MALKGVFDSSLAGWFDSLNRAQGWFDKEFYSTTYTFKLSAGSWVVPTDVYSIDGTAIGCGGSPGNSTTNASGCGGGGGASALNPSISVTPGETLTIEKSAAGGAGFSSILRGATVLLRADYGRNGGTFGSPGVGGLATNSTGTTKYDGGSGGIGATSGSLGREGGGGGGAGGATGAGSAGDPGSGLPASGGVGNAPGGNGAGSDETAATDYGGGGAGGSNGWSGLYLSTPARAGLVLVTYTQAPPVFVRRTGARWSHWSI